MSAAYPDDEDSEASREGTAAHELSEVLIRMSEVDTVTLNVASSLVGSAMSNGVLVTEEMLEAAWEYADDVVRTRTAHPHGELHIERGIKAPDIHELSYGTPDAWLYDPVNYTLFVWDYKHGYGVVEAFENWQMINYVAGIFHELGVDGIQDRDITVYIRIAQPRAFHRDGAVREWKVKGSELRGYFNILHNNAQTALSHEAEAHTGDHCRYCNARHACPAALKAGLDMYEVASAPLPVELSTEAMATQLSVLKRAKKQLEYLESGFEEQIKGKIRSGVMVPGWGLAQGLGREKWSKPVSEVISLGEMLGVDLSKPQEAITPTQAKKLGVDAEIIRQYADKPHTGLKLVAVDNAKARKVFTK